MATSGIGQDGYVRIQKETTYGTPLTNSMTDLPVSGNFLVKSWRENIEKDSIISSRLLQNPDLGNEKVTFSGDLEAHPAYLGRILKWVLGAATSAGPTDSTYTHTWLVPITGKKTGLAHTIQQALAGDTAKTYSGCKPHKITIKGEIGGNVMVSIEGTGESQEATGVSRASSFSYTTSYAPFNLSMLTVTLNSGSPVTQPISSFEMTLDLNYEGDRFKSGSAQQLEPEFNGIPKFSVKMSIEADDTFKEAARSHTPYALTLSFTGTDYAAGTTYFLFVAEIPKARLKPDTEIPNGNEKLKMDLEFECGYGGTTTGSGSTSVMAEFRVKDASATHA